MSVPYAHTTSGANARSDILKTLRHFGAESVGFMDEFESGTLILAFRHRGINVQLKASAHGWAQAYLRENPHNSRRHYNKEQWERRAMDQGMIAVNSILRDWVKGQVTAIETGILKFEQVFLPYMLTHDGRSVLEHIQSTNLLSAPKQSDD